MRSWFRWFKSDRSQSRRQARQTRVGQVEALETRAMMAGLVHAGDLGYLGAFNVPKGDIGASTFEYGGTALAHNPANNSLFMVGHDWHQSIAEVSIPALRTGSLSNLATAGVRQSFTPVLNRVPNQTLDEGDGVKLGGLIVDGNRLIGTAYEFYDGEQNAVDSHFTLSSLNLGSAQVGGLYQVGSLGGGHVGGYMGKVPLEWQDQIGAPYLTGQAALSIIGRTSAGPAAFGFDPAKLGTNTTPVTKLVHYPLAHPLAAESTQNPLFNTTTEITGVVFPEGTDSVLFIGSHGTGKWWYGEANEGGYDPYRSEKGPHAPDYVYQVWAYDVRDLLAVKNGQKQAWEIKPYDVWDFELPYFEGGKHIGGVAYDAASGRLYVSQQFGNGAYPVIHAYQVGTPTPSTPIPPPDGNLAPTGVKLTNVIAGLPENRVISANLKVADITVIDDGLGTNKLSLSGTNAGSFLISGKSLYLRSGVKLDFETRPALHVTVRATDTSLGTGASTGYKLTMTDVNDAPVLDSSRRPTLNRTWVNSTQPSTTLVSALTKVGITDQDAGALRGIAVTGASNMHGTWQYTLNGGQSWLAMGQPSASGARLLPANSQALVRFLPNAGFDGTVNLWYHAWDRTRGTAGGTLPVAGNQGGSRPLSRALRSAALEVVRTNQAPVVSLGGTIGYTANAAAITLAPGATVTDVDSSNFAGGVLKVSIGYGGDASNRLRIGGPFKLSEGKVTYWGQVIGTIRSNGFGTNPLAIALNSAATPAIVQRLIRSVNFRTVDDPSCSVRSVCFQLTDGDGGTSRLQYKSVKVTAHWAL